MAEPVAEDRWGEGANAEAITAWDGPLFDRFLKFRHVMTTGLGVHGDEALRRLPLRPGARMLDIGCGFGDTTLRIAGIVGPSGEAVGVDASERFVEASRADAEAAGAANARFFAADVQVDDLGGPYDGAFSRMGTMFFANPVAALRNVRRSLVPGGRLTMVVWRRREDNDWLYRAQQIVEGFVARPEEYDDPTCGPGPFSMAGADTTSDILLHAGFADVELRRCDLPIMMGRDTDEAIDLVMSLGPAGEILRLQGDAAAHLHGDIDAALREALAEYTREDGEVWARASTWIVTATAPADGAG
jgi:ubiquinone/menaquinone biosynthesis C-methylase UbiE